MDVDGVVTHHLNTYAGSFVAADINEVTPRARGITMDTANVAPVRVNTLASLGRSRSTIDYVSQFYGHHLTSGSSILFDVTDPDFVNGAAGNVDIKIMYLDDTDGTIKIYYDSTSGEKLGATYMMSSSDSVLWTTKTIQVNDARFNSSTQDIRIEVVSGDPVFAHVTVESDNFLGLPDHLTDLYLAWAGLYGGAGVIGTETNDYDADGLANLVEYALNGNPTNATDTGDAPRLVHAGGTLRYVHPQRADDARLIYTVETSTNLTSGVWTHAGFSVVSTNVTGGTLDSVTHSVDTIEDEKFIRLSIGKN